MIRSSFASRASSVVLFAAVSTLFGCDSGRSTPTSLGSSVEDVPPESSLYLTFILPSERSLSMDAYEQEAILAGGLENTILHLAQPAKDDPPSSQINLIREAVADGASAIIILPQDPKTVAPALLEAREKGVSVVVIQRPVEVEGTPFTLVTHPPLEESVKTMLGAVIKGVKEFNRSPNGPAVVTVNRSANDAGSSERAEMIREALKSAGVSEITTLEHGVVEDDAKTLYQRALDLKPLPTMMIVNDDLGLPAVARSIAADKQHLDVAPVLGGLIRAKHNFDLVDTNQVASVIDMNVKTLVRRAVRIAIDQARGETVPPKTVIERRIPVATDLKDPRPYNEGLSSPSKGTRADEE